ENGGRGGSAEVVEVEVVGRASGTLADSQIRLDEYPHVFNRFKKTLERVAFFGDAQQLAPYNSAQIPEIKSVFQLPHLLTDAFFLDTQYRMPSLVGDFISKHVYNSKLHSASSVSSSKECLKFIDVRSGLEESSGHSTKNVAELQVVLALIQYYYADKNFKILTVSSRGAAALLILLTEVLFVQPYDAQRNEIEGALKAAKLPWEDRVFNVDSFQGQEDEIIIVSVVKTARLGFLNEIRRSNVMLTRLKKAMIIVTSRNFLQTIARATLLGRMACALTSPTFDWISEKSCLDGTAELPERGAPRPIAEVIRTFEVIEETSASSEEDEGGLENNVEGKEKVKKVKLPKNEWGTDWGATITTSKKKGTSAKPQADENGLICGVDAGWF
ncbi:hypothetical protein P7C70_g8796, partial [Phenoliferia sp. Uapishka_3]